MLPKKLLASHNHVFVPLFLLFFLMLGVVTSVNQTQQNQSFNSNAATSTSSCDVLISQLTPKAQEQQMLTIVNQYRAQNGLGQLTMNSTLKRSSAWLSSDMKTHNTLSHTDSLGRTPDIRLTACGYDISKSFGETIASGTSDPNAVFNAWKNDPPHNQILLTSTYNITGIDMESDSLGNVFWTMDFGVSSGAPTNAPTSTTITPTGTSVSPTVTTTVAPTGIIATPTISPTISPTPTIPDFPTPTTGPITADMQIFVKIKVNGIGQDGNTNPRHQTRHVAAIVVGADNQTATTGTAFLNYDGSNYFSGVIHLGKLSQGPYFIKLVSDFTLQVLAKPEFQNLMINQVNTIPPVTLYQGDMNADNILDINDYNLVLPCFQSLNTCPNVNLIDFNDDGTTDVKDYNLLLNSFEILHGN